MQSKSEIKAGFTSKWEEITNIVSRTYVTGFTSNMFVSPRTMSSVK